MRDMYATCHNCSKRWALEELDQHNSDAQCEDVILCPTCNGASFGFTLLEDDKN